MLPIDPASRQEGGTFVRPGAVAWGGTRGAPDGAYSSEAVEQVLAAGSGRDPGGRGMKSGNFLI